MKQIISLMLLSFLIVFAVSTAAKADPCGMVPPIWTGNTSPITRIGLQKTYVFHKDGVETFVIRPGFSGKVDNFGMLIPFPNPPEIRKVADNVFEHITNAIDPPEVVVDLRIRRLMQRGGLTPMSAMADSTNELAFMSKDKVNVLKEEAVGMYEVAVLQAGSAFALKKWLDKNGYQYPEGMDKVTDEYVEQKWCFVAVKTKVGQQKGVAPKPGQRKVNPNLPSGSVFDGNVQGMGFRFKSPELVVPMRLSAFNDGELRNIVYLLTDGPRKIRAIPEEYVVRQVSGNQLFKNVTQLLPLRIIGGTEKDIPPHQRQNLPALRNPEPKNGIAKDLFASDLLAVATGELSLRHEEEEKELLRIGEYFGLRGGEVDADNSVALAESRKATVEKGLEMLKEMTLTVVDGDFPREVIAQQNLTFAQYNMPGARNNILNYDANMFGPGKAKDGILKVGSVDWNDVEKQIVRDHRNARIGLRTLVGFGVLGLLGTLIYRKPKALLLIAIFTGLLAGSAFAAEPISSTSLRIQEDDSAALIADLVDSKTATDAIEKIKTLANSDDAKRDQLISDLLKVVKNDVSLPKRGWAIAALAKIGGQDVDEYLLDIHADESQKKIVRTWAAAARVTMTRTLNGLIEKANLIRQFPALGRPIGLRIVEKMTGDNANVNLDKVLGVTQKLPQLQQALAPTILSFGSDKLADAMFKGKEQNTRRTAASYLGALVQQGQTEEVVVSVVERLKFDTNAQDVPWSGGPLFIPGIQWPKDDAKNLVGNLVRWHLWCEVNGKSSELRQIHNNIRSLGLARAAGYQTPGGRDINAVAWLQAWGKAVGRQEIEAILKEQGVNGDDKYQAALNGLLP